MLALLDPSLVSASSMAGNVMAKFPSIVKLMNVVASCAGIYFSVMGVLKMPAVARHETKLVVPIMWLIAGVSLINLSGAITSTLQTFFGGSASVHSLLAYSAASGMPAESKQLLQLIIMAFRIFGLFAAIRGLMMLRHVGDPNHREGNAFSGAMVRLIAGCFLLNIVQTADFAAATLGYGHPFSS